MQITHQNIHGLISILTLFPFLNGIQKGEYAPIPNWFRSSCSQIVVFQNFAKFTWKNLCWSHFLTMLQISRSETLLKRDSGTGIFLWIFCNFSKNLFTEHLWMTAPADSSVLTKPLFIDDTLFFFPSFFSFIIDNCLGVYWKSI